MANALTPEGQRLQTRVATFTLPTVFRAVDTDRLFAPNIIPTADDLLTAISALEVEPCSVTPEQLAEQYDAEREERFEEEASLLPKVRAVASLLSQSKYCVVYTGAGISTSAQIPDYRGPSGVWTMLDKGEVVDRKLSWHDFAPTFAHYAITELVRRGLVRFVMTTNVDGLHWRTGLPPHLQEELHGSAFKLYCPNCQSFHYRPYDSLDHLDTHITGESCPWCSAGLLDTLVQFSEGYRSWLGPIVLRHHAERADLAIVLRTSLCVQSSSSYPIVAVGKGNLVIVNTQNTSADEFANVRIFTQTDMFFRLLMVELGMGEFDETEDVLDELSEEYKQKGLRSD
jgi:mono-ADP-ribosyltransferase sirtuin 6